MSPDPVRLALTHLQFPANSPFAQDLEQAGGRVVRQASGHLVFYRPDGRRFLAADPAGSPLHECEWSQNSSGQVQLLRTRMRLDWGQWVGIRPAGLVNETSLNLSHKPGWQRLTADSLRHMAAQAMGVPIEEVRFFYGDDDLVVDARGQAIIRHKKDAFYVLETEGFERTRFMSCMGAMHWDGIDFLPVVELFKSLLPGTGSAAFELIRGLYDDQNQGQPVPRPLRYRGIPTYPSEAAFRLFSSFFTPQAPPGHDPLTLFMDQDRSHQVIWVPAMHPPLRFFDDAQRACLTVQGGVLQKVTMADDPTGLPYVNPKGRRTVPFDRSLTVAGDRIVLRDRENEMVLLPSQPLEEATASADCREVSRTDWRSVFACEMPPIRAVEAFSAVLFYPDDDQPIGELAAQPFVADYLQDLAEQDREIGAMISRAEHILIDNGDAVITTCIPFDRPRDYTVHVHHPAFAQRQAQQLWTISADLQRWDWLERIRFLPVESFPETTIQQRYDLIYDWVPLHLYDQPARLSEHVRIVRRLLQTKGHAFLVGPVDLAGPLMQERMALRWQEGVENLPTFRMHRSILPKAKLRNKLTLFHVTTA
ncbi:MAG TPA: hypothetical protein VEI50_15020 [Nitrospiraceae bacterium]|nr:hypothetical protein [Nitrospiraceae bacterium]